MKRHYKFKRNQFKVLYNRIDYYTTKFILESGYIVGSKKECYKIQHIFKELNL